MQGQSENTLDTSESGNIPTQQTTTNDLKLIRQYLRKHGWKKRMKTLGSLEKTNTDRCTSRSTTIDRVVDGTTSDDATRVTAGAGADAGVTTAGGNTGHGRVVKGRSSAKSVKDQLREWGNPSGAAAVGNESSVSDRLVNERPQEMNFQGPNLRSLTTGRVEGTAGALATPFSRGVSFSLDRVAGVDDDPQQIQNWGHHHNPDHAIPNLVEEIARVKKELDMIESRHKKDLDIVEERHKNELDMAKKELDDVKATLTWTKQELNNQRESAKIDQKIIQECTKTVERLTIQDDDTHKQIDDKRKKKINDKSKKIDDTNKILVQMEDLDEVTL